MVIRYFPSFLKCCSASFCTCSHRFFRRAIAWIESKNNDSLCLLHFNPRLCFQCDQPILGSAVNDFHDVGYSVVTHIMVAIGAVIVGTILGISREVIAASVLITIFGNVGNFGLSLLDFRFGEVSKVPATVYFLSILVTSFVIGVGVAGWVRKGSLSAVTSVLKTPALLALPPAAIFAATGWEVPLSVERLTGLLGQAMIPTMIVTLGVQLSSVQKLDLNVDTWIACGLRLLLAPLLAFGLAFIFPLGELEKNIGILQSAMPTAILAAIKQLNTISFLISSQPLSYSQQYLVCSH